MVLNRGLQILFWLLVNSMKDINIGDLVKITDYGRRQLENSPRGYGLCTKIYGNNIVQIIWPDTGRRGPFNKVWLEVVNGVVT